MRTDNKSKRRKKDRWNNRLAMIGITAVVISLAVVVNLKSASIRTKDFGYQMREEALMKQTAQEESRAEYLRAYNDYVGSSKHTEEIAKEKLGLVKPDEILLKPQTNK